MGWLWKQNTDFYTHFFPGRTHSSLVSLIFDLVKFPYPFPSSIPDYPSRLKYIFVLFLGCKAVTTLT